MSVRSMYTYTNKNSVGEYMQESVGRVFVMEKLYRIAVYN